MRATMGGKILRYEEQTVDLHNGKNFNVYESNRIRFRIVALH